VTEVIAHGSGQVRLIREAEIGGQPGQARLAGASRSSARVIRTRLR
jgi:hypothetical protein